jgi:hypothetical protein
LGIDGLGRQADPVGPDAGRDDDLAVKTSRRCVSAPATTTTKETTMQRRELLKKAGAGGVILGAPMVLRAQQQYKAEYKMSTVVGTAFAWGKGGETFANLVRERTGGRIDVKQYPARPGCRVAAGSRVRRDAQGVIDVLRCADQLVDHGAPWRCSRSRSSCRITRPDDAVINSPVVTKDWFDIIRLARGPSRWPSARPAIGRFPSPSARSSSPMTFSRA